MQELNTALFDLKMALIDAVRPLLKPMAYFLVFAWLGFATWKVIAWLS